MISGAIDATYHADYANYAKSLDSMDESKVYPPIEISRIEAFHRKCELNRPSNYAIANQPNVMPKNPSTAEQMLPGTSFTAARGAVYLLTKHPTSDSQSEVMYAVVMSNGRF